MKKSDSEETDYQLAAFYLSDGIVLFFNKQSNV